MCIRDSSRIAGYLAVAARVDGSRTELRDVRRQRMLWQEQADRIAMLLTTVGAAPPTRDVDTETATSSDEEAATSAGSRDASSEDLRRAVRDELPDIYADLASSTPTNRPLLASLAAQHTSVLSLGGADPDWPELIAPSGTAAVPVLAATRPAVFGLEVVAARSVGDERDLYESVLRPPRAITRALTTLAGEAAPVPPLGYDLPEPLATQEQRVELARTLVGDVMPAALSVVDRAGDSARHIASYVRIVAEADRWSRRLGTDPRPFPGMSLPS